MSFVEWWDSLGKASQIFYCIAVPSTLVLVIQTVLMFLGFDDGPDGELDFDSPDTDLFDGVFGENEITDLPDVSGMESLHIFTFRGIVAFLVVFGWVGIVMQSANVKLFITIPVATVCATVMMVAVAYLFKAIMRLKSNGAADNRNAVGAAGKVYLTIPPSRTGEGKVNVMLQGVYVERNAVTDETESIPTGAEIIVLGTSGQTSLVVKRK